MHILINFVPRENLRRRTLHDYEACFESVNGRGGGSVGGLIEHKACKIGVVLGQGGVFCNNDLNRPCSENKQVPASVASRLSSGVDTIAKCFLASLFLGEKVITNPGNGEKVILSVYNSQTMISPSKGRYEMLLLQPVGPSLPMTTYNQVNRRTTAHYQGTTMRAKN